SGTRAPRASPPVVPGPLGRATLQSGARRPRPQLLPHILHGLGGRERALGTAGFIYGALQPSHRVTAGGRGQRELERGEPRALGRERRCRRGWRTQERERDV